MNANLTDIAAQTGVSAATVSRALRGKGPVKEETRDRIIRTAVRLGYPVPRELRRAYENLQCVALVLPSLASGFLAEFADRLAQDAEESGYLLLPIRAEDAQQVTAALDVMADRICGGIILAPNAQLDFEQVRSARYPTVVMNVGDADVGVPVVNIDNYRGAFAMTEHLIRNGFRRIAMISGPSASRDAQDRLRGYRAALEEHGIEHDPVLVVEGNFASDGGFYGFGRLMSLPVRPDVVFAANDTMAFGACDCARAMGLVVPDDIGIVGFDDVPGAKLFRPALTTVHVPVQEVCTRTLGLLRAQLEGDESVHGTLHAQNVLTGVVVRDSCGTHGVPARQQLRPLESVSERSDQAVES